MSWSKPRTGLAIGLDLDETLIHTFDSRELAYLQPDDEAKSRLRSFKYRGGNVMTFIKRPYCDEFLDFVSNYFTVVAVWSAGEDSYVDHIVSILFAGRPEPQIIMRRSDCAPEYPTKPLEWLIARDPQRLSLRNTLFVDDNPKTWNHPENIINIPAFDPRASEINNSSDTALLDIMNWLETPKVKNTTDVRQLEKPWIPEVYDPFKNV